MIVNVNPYDTGFDENSHVMRFSAIAREVQTTAGNKMTTGGTLRRQISTQFSALKQAVRPMKIKVTVPVIPPPPTSGPSSTSATRKPIPEHRASADSYVMVEEELEVVEEDAEDESDEEDERDVMVDHLFEQLREMKQRVGWARVLHWSSSQPAVRGGDAKCDDRDGRARGGCARDASDDSKNAR